MTFLKVSGFLVSALLIILIALGSFEPETYIYATNQVPKKYIAAARDLGLIQKNELVKYFYSDALLDIKEGMYFATDRNLVLFSNEWQMSEIVMPLEDFVINQVIYDDSFLEDTTVFITDKHGNDIAFPLSSEKGMDKKFVNYLKSFANK